MRVSIPPGGVGLAHEDEYTTAMLAAMDLIWGEGFMAPGGEGHVEQMVRGIELRGRQVLDLGCGQGRAACVLAARYGAQVTGTDIEAPLVSRARARIERERLTDRVRVLKVAPGPLNFTDGCFDAIVISGAMTQIENKLAMYRECLRVLAPGGVLSCYDWMVPTGDLSDDMYRWFELEGLTYAVRPPTEHLRLLEEAGFEACACRDKSAWYRAEARREHEALCTTLRPRLFELLGDAQAGRFIESWRLLALLCERGELLQVYTRARRPLANSGCRARGDGTG